MPKAKITFSNNETLTLDETSIINVIGHFGDTQPVDSDKAEFIVKEPIQYGDTLTFENYHVELGVVPDLINYFHNVAYFFIHNHPEVIYATASIVKIESDINN